MKIPLCTFIRNTVRTDSMIEIPLCTFIQDCTIIRDTRVCILSWPSQSWKLLLMLCQFSKWTKFCHCKLRKIKLPFSVKEDSKSMTKLDCLLKSTPAEDKSSSWSMMSSDASQISSATFSHSLLTSKLLLESLNLLKSRVAFNFLPIRAAAAAFLSAIASTSSFLISSIISSWNWTSIQPKFFG